MFTRIFDLYQAVVGEDVPFYFLALDRPPRDCSVIFSGVLGVIVDMDPAQAKGPCYQARPGPAYLH